MHLKELLTNLKYKPIHPYWEWPGLKELYEEIGINPSSDDALTKIEAIKKRIGFDEPREYPALQQELQKYERLLIIKYKKEACAL